MTGEDGPVQHCQLGEQVNLLTALAAADIEYIDVDENRSIVIYQHAIIRVIAIDGRATAAQTFDVELWKEPAHDPTRDPDDLLTAFIDELLATTDIKAGTERCVAGRNLNLGNRWHKVLLVDVTLSH